MTAIAGDTALAASAPGEMVVGLRRLSEREYRNSIADIFGNDISVKGVFEPSTRVGGLLSSSSTVLSITPAGFQSYSQMADSIAAQVTSATHRDGLLSCKPRSATDADDACASTVLSHYGLLLFRRPLADDELKSRLALVNQLARQSKDFYTGLRYGLATLLEAPEFLFRKEVAVPTTTQAYTLDGYSRATRLSYMLWDTTPDTSLLAAARSGELMSDSGVAAQVDRMMGSPRLETGMRAFFADMLELDTFENTTKDSLIYPKWSNQIATSAREETLRSVTDLTLRQNGDVRDLMTTRKTFLNRSLASIYQVPFSFSGDWVPYEFSPDSGRSGVLTQVSTLSMFSHPGRSSPTKRGVAIMDIFLCEPTPLPPPNVDFSIVNNTNGPLKTVRERMMVHATNRVCASCHTHSDPIGLTLEGFDSEGVSRSTENGVPIDLTGTIRGKSFVGAAGLGAYLHDEPKFPACLARKLYAYGKGTASVRPSAYAAALKIFQDSGYRLRALIRGLAESPDFFTVPAPKQAAAAQLKVADQK